MINEYFDDYVLSRIFLRSLRLIYEGRTPHLSLMVQYAFISDNYLL